MDTRLGQRAQALAENHAGESGYYLISDGVESLAARLRLIQASERSIDVQCFFILRDVVGRLFVNELLKAADRGVRVRLLLDDINTSGYGDGLKTLDSHPNVEVRIFNPFAHRSFRLLDFATDFSRVNHRMHNKSVTFDNQVTIVGGRNIGADYFGASVDHRFADLDVLGIGPIAAQVSSAFDRHWNSQVSVPVDALLPNEVEPGALDQLRGRVDKIADEAGDTPYGHILEDEIREDADIREDELTWCSAKVVADPPDKAADDLDPDDPDLITSELGPFVRAAESELIVISPYFVPRKKGVELFRSLRERGVRVVVVTNSLASNDVVPVHTGYARYRNDLLEMGVEIWEVKIDRDRTHERSKLGISRSSLHTKAFVIDRRHLFVGSFNWDPRSKYINTEMGVFFDSPELAGSTAQHIDSLLPNVAYRVDLDEEGDLRWSDFTRQPAVIHTKEPDAGFWLRFEASLYRFIPIEGQL
jgi:putative cardiolipin synthase